MGYVVGWPHYLQRDRPVPVHGPVIGGHNIKHDCLLSGLLVVPDLGSKLTETPDLYILQTRAYLAQGQSGLAPL